jgi:hypothetical protein
VKFGETRRAEARERLCREEEAMYRKLTSGCELTDQIREVQRSSPGCEECLQVGDPWVRLRECLTCAHVGCCDQSASLLRRNGLWFRLTLSPGGLLHLRLAT